MGMFRQLRRLGAAVVCRWIDLAREMQLFPQGFYDQADEATGEVVSVNRRIAQETDDLTQGGGMCNDNRV
jgi:hypothetical protein